MEQSTALFLKNLSGSFYPEMQIENEKIQWYLTAKVPTILFIDARAFFPVCLLLFNILSKVLWVATFVSILFFGVLAKKGLYFSVLLRKIRHKICGNVRVARPWWYWRRWRVPYVDCEE